LVPYILTTVPPRTVPKEGYTEFIRGILTYLIGTLIPLTSTPFSEMSTVESPTECGGTWHMMAVEFKTFVAGTILSSKKHNTVLSVSVKFCKTKVT
jgi:hypothetical protein